MELWLIGLIFLDLVITSWYFSNRIDANEKRIKQLENAKVIMAKRIRKMDESDESMEVSEVERHSVIITIDENGVPEVRVDED